MRLLRNIQIYIKRTLTIILRTTRKTLKKAKKKKFTTIKINKRHHLFNNNNNNTNNIKNIIANRLWKFLRILPLPVSQQSKGLVILHLLNKSEYSLLRRIM